MKEVGPIVDALLELLPRADDCIVEFSAWADAPVEWRATDAALEPGPQQLLDARGWRSAVAVPAPDRSRLMIVADRDSARRWSAGDIALCRLAAAMVPPLEFTGRLAAGGAVALLLVEVEPGECDPLGELQRSAGEHDLVGRLSTHTGAIAFRSSEGDMDAAIARLERSLPAAGASDWWFGFAQADPGEMESDGLIERARQSLASARTARQATYHGCLLPRPLHFR